jgi:hypothetical protein
MTSATKVRAASIARTSGRDRGRERLLERATRLVRGRHEYELDRARIVREAERVARDPQALRAPRRRRILLDLPQGPGTSHVICAIEAERTTCQCRIAAPLGPTRGVVSIVVSRGGRTVRSVVTGVVVSRVVSGTPPREAGSVVSGTVVVPGTRGRGERGGSLAVVIVGGGSGTSFVTGGSGAPSPAATSGVPISGVATSVVLGSVVVAVGGALGGSGETVTSGVSGAEPPGHHAEGPGAEHQQRDDAAASALRERPESLRSFTVVSRSSTSVCASRGAAAPGAKAGSHKRRPRSEANGRSAKASSRIEPKRFFGSLGERAHHDQLEAARDLVAQLAGRHDLLVRHLLEDLEERVSIERPAAPVRHWVEHHTERVLVALGVGESARLASARGSCSEASRSRSSSP